jgi:broad specificity phosphatase PhoE
MSRSKSASLPPTRLLLIRHAEVERRYHRTFGGRIDMGLSPRGRRQARLLAQFLRARRIDAIYASPMKRVQQTLAPLLDTKPDAAPRHRHRRFPNLPAPVILPELREVDFGDWTGLNWEQVCEKFNLLTHQWLEHIERGTAPNGESGAALRARVEPCLRRIIAGHPGQIVAIFCHGGVARMILSILLEIPLARTHIFEIEYASVTQIALRPSHAEIELLNFTPWRDGVG